MQKCFKEQRQIKIAFILEALSSLNLNMFLWTFFLFANTFSLISVARTCFDIKNIF